MTGQIASVLESMSLSGELADWMIEQLNAERNEAAAYINAAKKKIQKTIKTIDDKLDRLTEAYLMRKHLVPLNLENRKKTSSMKSENLPSRSSHLTRRTIYGSNRSNGLYMALNN